MMYLVKNARTMELLGKNFDSIEEAFEFANYHNKNRGDEGYAVILEDDGTDFSKYAAYGIGDGIKITVEYCYECGWYIDINDHYECISTAVGTMKRFKELCQMFEIKTVMVSDGYLDPVSLADWDKRRAQYEKEEMHYDAVTLWEHTGDSSLLDRYERMYEN